jgi:hypothetical protein
MALLIAIAGYLYIRTYINNVELYLLGALLMFILLSVLFILLGQIDAADSLSSISFMIFSMLFVELGFQVYKDTKE